MTSPAGKIVYTVESYIPRDKTLREQYDDLDGEVSLRRMRLQVLMELCDEAHAELVKAIAKMDRLAKHHPELIDPLD